MLSILEGFLEEAREKVFITVEEPYCKEGQILSQCRGGYWTALLVWLARLSPASPLASSTFPGSVGGGWRVDLPWKLSPGPLPATTFL